MATVKTAGRPKLTETMRREFALYYAATGETREQLAERLGCAASALGNYQQRGIPIRNRAMRRAWGAAVERARRELHRQGRGDEAAELWAEVQEGTAIFPEEAEP